MDGGAWWAAVHGVAEGRTQLSDFTFTFHFNALEKEMATHSSVLAWRIPGTGEPGGLPSMGSHRVGHNWGDLAVAVAAAGLYIWLYSKLFPQISLECRSDTKNLINASIAWLFIISFRKIILFQDCYWFFFWIYLSIFALSRKVATSHIWLSNTWMGAPLN